ncbi:TraR/DksA family transcriptional regulator [Streptomyces sp. NBC_01538]|uniref:TraR/DksA family transcriptional regulator n=1 Tax=Streptomyces sp. NBC_01538 TaxID=2903897 RepID=UPI00386D8944
MVAKKTAVQQSASSSSTGSTAAEASGGGKGTDAKKSALKKGAAKKTAATKTVARKAVVKTAAKAAAVKTAVVQTAVEKKAAASRRDAAQGGGAGKRTSTKSTAKKSTANKAGAAEAAKKTGATTVVAKKSPGTATAAKKPGAVPKARIVTAAEPGELAVRPGEDPWTPQEVAQARAELQSEVLRLRAEIETSEQSLVGLMRDSGDGAGDDQADTGTKNITREGEMALAANAREMLSQDERALERLDAGTYGLCENCGNPIGKARMQAFPRATLCVECKQKQERRY